MHKQLALIKQWLDDPASVGDDDLYSNTVEVWGLSAEAWELVSRSSDGMEQLYMVDMEDICTLAQENKILIAQTTHARLEDIAECIDYLANAADHASDSKDVTICRGYLDMFEYAFDRHQCNTLWSGIT